MMSLLYEKVISTVNKSPDERSDVEIEQILPWFRKKSELFKSQKAEIVKDILKNCQFMTCKRDYVVIKQGDKGDCFFIILNGSVAIHIHTNLGEEGINYDEHKDDGDDDDFLGKKKKKELDRSLFGNYVGKIPAGRSFGELALINADCVRNASIIADETTDLIVVNRDLYNRSLKAFQEKEFNEKKQFVEEFHLFQGWQHRYKKQLAMSLRKEKITFDGIIVKQGCPLDGICFLLSGQAKMLMDPTQHEIQYPEQFPLPDIEELEKVEARESIRREMNMVVPKSDDKRNIYRSRSPSVIDKKKSHKNVEVCVMRAYEIIGDLELTFGLNSYAETIQCTQEAEIFILDQKNYERLIEKRNPQALDLMRDALHEKLKLRLTWIHGDDLPLCRYFIYKLDEKKRQELNRLRDYNRKRDLRGTIDYWKSGKLQNGPLIDQYGPGSVFYTIRMRASKKGLSNLRGKPGAIGFGITRHFGANRQHGAYLARHPNNHGMRHTGSDSENINGTHYSDYEDDRNYETDEELNGDVLDDVTDGLPSPIRRSRVVCESTSERLNSDPRTNKENKSRSDCSVDDFMDQEMNDLVLSRLETRIEAWHSKLNDPNPKKSAKTGKHTVKLHRYNIEDHQKPLPGKKIILKPKVKSKPNLLTLRLEAIENGNRPVSPPAFLTENSSGQSRDHFYDTSRDLSLEPDIENEDKGDRGCPAKRPLSSNYARATPTLQIRVRPKSARKYTAEEYISLKAELRRKQIAYRSLLMQPDYIY